MSGGGGGAAGPTTEQKRAQMKGHWESYQKWGADATKSFEQKSSSAKARMAASGVSTGSAKWTSSLNAIQSDYEKEVRGLESGATARILGDWAKSDQDRAYEDAITAQRAAAGPDADLSVLGAPKRGAIMGMADYMTQQFGVTKGVAGQTASEKSTAQAKSAGRGSRAASQGQADMRSPWL